MKRKLVILFCFFILSHTHAQRVSGTFTALPNQAIRIVGFNGFQTYLIDADTTDADGNFSLNYSREDIGIGYLSSSDNKPFIVILGGEDLTLQGDMPSAVERINILKGKENQLFAQYAKEHPRREQALSAWNYLENIYKSDSLFNQQKNILKAVYQEKLRLNNEDHKFLNSLPKNSYVQWFLPIRKLVSDVSTIAQYRTDEIPTTIAALRNIDYADPRLYKSDLLKDVIESHYWLLENMGQPLDTVYKEMNISINYLIGQLIKNEEKLNEISQYLFSLLEKHSLFKASEYLAVKLLTQKSCVLDDAFSKQLESYRKMKIGNTAPDILLEGDVIKNGNPIKTIGQLSDIKSTYTVIFFGASWCPNCVEEINQLLPLYEKWKIKELEVLFVALDTDADGFKKYTKSFPFISTCDYKKWDTKAAQDYAIFATPTFFLVDSHKEIVLRPSSIKQLDAWVEFNLKQTAPRL
jgi:thiol-disulfide isomerase/thioredoxin